MTYGQKLAILACLALSLSLTACTSNSVKRGNAYSTRQPDMSFAMNLALHTSLTTESGPLMDLDRSALSDGLRDAPDHQVANALERIGWAGLGVAHFNGFALPAGISPSTAASLDLFGALFLPGRAPHPALKPQVLAWMPTEPTDDAENAKAKLESLLKDAFIKGLPAGFSVTERSKTTTPLFGAPFTKTYVNLVGPGCPTESGLECRLWIYVGHSPSKKATPPLVGGSEESYQWQNWPDGSSSKGHQSASFFVGLTEPSRSAVTERNSWFDENARIFVTTRPLSC